MRGLKTWAWATAIALMSTTQASAQLPTNIQIPSLGGGSIPSLGAGGLSGFGSSGFGSTTGSTGTGTSSTGTSSTGTGSNGTGSGTGLQGTELQRMIEPPSITAPTATTSSSLDPIFGKFSANPYFQGKDFDARNVAPGGFGVVLYTNTANRTNTTTGTRAGGLNTGIGGQRGGLQNAANQSGILVPLPVQINYVAQMRFPTPPVPASQIQTELRGIIDNGGLENAKAVQVVVAGTNVTLRGAVKDDEEARLVEGLVRLTPGVGAIKNELTFPVAMK